MQTWQSASLLHACPVSRQCLDWLHGLSAHALHPAAPGTAGQATKSSNENRACRWDSSRHELSLEENRGRRMGVLADYSRSRSIFSRGLVVKA